MGLPEEKHILILGECELELVPREIAKSPVVASRAKRVGKAPEEMLLQSGELYKAMRALPDWERRGRPDLVHFALTIATDSPAFSDGRLSIILHLRDNLVVRIKEGLRPPKEYSRFCGLIEQLLLRGKVPFEGDNWLMKIDSERKSLSSLAKETGLETFVFDSGENPIEPGDLGKLLSSEGKGKCIVVGGFPHGTFHDRPLGRTITVSKKELLAGTVVGFISASLGDGKRGEQ